MATRDWGEGDKTNTGTDYQRAGQKHRVGNKWLQKPPSLTYVQAYHEVDRPAVALEGGVAMGPMDPCPWSPMGPHPNFKFNFNFEHPVPRYDISQRAQG